MEIRSRVTLENVIRKSTLTGLVVFFAAFYAYDGYVRYPKKTYRKAIRDLNPKPPEDATYDPAITSESTAWIEEGMLLRDVVEKLGEPGWKNGDDTEVQYFGPACVLRLIVKYGKIAKVVYPETYKSELDLTVQKLLALILALVAIPLLFHMTRLLTFRTRLDDNGLKLSGKPLIPFEAIRSINAERFDDKGWLDVQYELEGVEGTVRLDEYWMKEFKPIVAEVCRRAGLDNPTIGGDSSAEAETSSREPADQLGGGDVRSDS